MSATVLIIEDDLDFAESLRIAIEAADIQAQVVTRDFASGLSDLSSIAPHLVILDLYKGIPQGGNPSGRTIWDRIWQTSFVPVIFASASREQDLIDQAEIHPLLRFYVKSGQDVVTRIVADTRLLLPVGEKAADLQREFRADAASAAQVALAQSSRHVLDRETPEAGLSVLASSARRRLSALMREKSEEGRERVFAWEQYIFPSVGAHLFTADVLRRRGGDKSDAADFRVVMTPSCDLAQNKTLSCLSARCISLHEFWVKASWRTTLTPGNQKAERARADILRKLSESQLSGFRLLPRFSDEIPHMAVSLRDLELLSVGSDAVSAHDSAGDVFDRIASVASPYREQMAWAFLQIAGRPGVPEQDNDAWLADMLERLTAAEERDG